MLFDEILARAKGIAALVGAGATAALGVLPQDEYRWLAVVAAVATAVSVYAIPNKDLSYSEHDLPVELPDDPAVPTLDPEVLPEIDPEAVYEPDATPPGVDYEPRH